MAAEVVIRRERSDDATAVRAINLGAFGGAVEADLVDAIRANGGPQLSLVAVVGVEVAGHILFSEVTVGTGGAASGMGLAPMAVLPARQRQGVGSALVRRGLELLAADGCRFVVVLGHPGYYPRFGFVPASRHGLASEYEGVPDEAFMALELAPGALAEVSGVVRYRAEFDASA